MMVTRPVLRYPGGKFTIAKWIIGHFPPHAVYVEPFGGGASVLMMKPRSSAEVYNDINSEIVNVFRVLRDPQQAAALKQLCELTPYAREENAFCHQPTNDPIEAARRIIFRSFAGFGADSAYRYNGFRTNDKNGQHGTDAMVWRNYPDCIHAFTDRLRGVTIENKNADLIFQEYDSPDTLFYCDPPYVGTTREKHLYPNEMHENEMHRQLSNILKNLDGKVIISGYRSDLYDKIFKGWGCFERKGKKSMGKSSIECIWINPAANTQRLF